MNAIDIIYGIHCVVYTLYYNIFTNHTLSVMNNGFLVYGRGAAKGRKRASIYSQIHGADAELRWIWIEVENHILSGDQTFPDGPTPLLHNKSGQNSPPFTVSSLFAGSDTRHIWDSGQCRRTGIRLVSHLKVPEHSTQHPHRLINHRKNQNREAGLGWCHVMTRDGGFVKTRGINQTHITAVSDF